MKMLTMRMKNVGLRMWIDNLMMSVQQMKIIDKDEKFNGIGSSKASNSWGRRNGRYKKFDYKVCGKQFVILVNLERHKKIHALFHAV